MNKINNQTNDYNDRYRIVLTCYDSDSLNPYADYIDQMFDNFDEAYSVLVKCAIDETQSLNGDDDKEYFKLDLCGDNMATIRLCTYPDDVETDNDYRLVTLYNIHKLKDLQNGLYIYRNMYITKVKQWYIAESEYDFICKRRKLNDVLLYIDNLFCNDTTKNRGLNSEKSELKE